MELNGRTFRAIANSSHGTLNTETRMTFADEGGDVTAVYGGGTIRRGYVVARRVGPNDLEMLYHCITTMGELKAGRALATLSTGGKMHLDWQWLTGDGAAGTSDWIVEPAT
jgi:hypothetical protein